MNQTSRRNFMAVVAHVEGTAGGKPTNVSAATTPVWVTRFIALVPVMAELDGIEKRVSF